MEYSKELYNKWMRIIKLSNEDTIIDDVTNGDVAPLIYEIDRLQSIVDKFNTGFVNAKHVEQPEPPFRKSIDARGNEIALQFQADA